MCTPIGDKSRGNQLGAAADDGGTRKLRLRFKLLTSYFGEPPPPPARSACHAPAPLYPRERPRAAFPDFPQDSTFEKLFFRPQWLFPLFLSLFPSLCHCIRRCSRVRGSKGQCTYAGESEVWAVIRLFTRKANSLSFVGSCEKGGSVRARWQSATFR